MQAYFHLNMMMMKFKKGKRTTCNMGHENLRANVHFALQNVKLCV